MHLSLAGCAMKIIYTRKGEEILVDDEDYERINQYTWRLDKDGYAVRSSKHPDPSKKTGTVVRMHREVMGLAFGDRRQVDHRFGVKADNRKSELRICTGQQNRWNVGRLSSNTSGYKNVTWVDRRRKWVARISEGGRKRRLIGYFDTAEDAYQAYCAAAQQAHGEFACN